MDHHLRRFPQVNKKYFIKATVEHGSKNIRYFKKSGKPELFRHEAHLLRALDTKVLYHLSAVYNLCDMYRRRINMTVFAHHYHLNRLLSESNSNYIIDFFNNRKFFNF